MRAGPSKQGPPVHADPGLDGYKIGFAPIDSAREDHGLGRVASGQRATITHADPHGKAPICKVGRDPQVHLIAEEADGLRRLAAVPTRCTPHLTPLTRCSPGSARSATWSRSTCANSRARPPPRTRSARYSPGRRGRQRPGQARQPRHRADGHRQAAQLPAHQREAHLGEALATSRPRAVLRAGRPSRRCSGPRTAGRRPAWTPSSDARPGSQRDRRACGRCLRPRTR